MHDFAAIDQGLNPQPLKFEIVYSNQKPNEVKNRISSTVIACLSFIEFDRKLDRVTKWIQDFYQLYEPEREARQTSNQRDIFLYNSTPCIAVIGNFESEERFAINKVGGVAVREWEGYNHQDSVVEDYRLQEEFIRSFQWSNQEYDNVGIKAPDNPDFSFLRQPPYQLSDDAYEKYFAQLTQSDYKGE